MYMEESGNEKEIRHNPRKWTGKTCTKESNAWNQSKSDNASSNHFHDTCDDGKERKAHALNQEAENIDQCQWKIKTALYYKKQIGVCNDSSFAG